MIAWLERQPEPVRSVEWVFDLDVENYLGGDLNVVALALLVRELSIFAESWVVRRRADSAPSWTQFLYRARYFSGSGLSSRSLSHSMFIIHHRCPS